jgi:arginyl-tRNA--protein-N-Asp/Glu arginylyltransferase
MQSDTEEEIKKMVKRREKRFLPLVALSHIRRTRTADNNTNEHEQTKAIESPKTQISDTVTNLPTTSEPWILIGVR